MSESERYETWREDHQGCAEKIDALERDLRVSREDTALAEALVISHEGHITNLEHDLSAARCRLVEWDTWAGVRESLKERLAVLEAADRAWENVSLVQLVAERRKLRERVGHLEELLKLAADAANGWKILHEESQERVAKLEDLLNAYKNALCERAPGFDAETLRLLADTLLAQAAEIDALKAAAIVQGSIKLDEAVKQAKRREAIKAAWDRVTRSRGWLSCLHKHNSRCQSNGIHHLDGCTCGADDFRRLMEEE